MWTASIFCLLLVGTLISAQGPFDEDELVPESEHTIEKRWIPGGFGGGRGFGGGYGRGFGGGYGRGGFGGGFGRRSYGGFGRGYGGYGWGK